MTTDPPPGGRRATTPARAVVLRATQPPKDHLDFDDRHDTRATESDAMARRYRQLRVERRKDDRHLVLLVLLVLAGGVAVFVLALAGLLALVPVLSAAQAAQIVAIPYGTLMAGLGVRSGAQAIVRWHGGRKPSGTDPPGTSQSASGPA